MFTKKQQTADIIKKSSLKVQDAKKDVFARLKHLKTILGESSDELQTQLALADKKVGWFKWSLMANPEFCIIFMGTSSGFVTLMF